MAEFWPPPEEFERERKRQQQTLAWARPVALLLGAIVLVTVAGRIAGVW